MSRRYWTSWRWIFLLLCAGILLAQWPVPTRYGINYRWTSKKIPLYEKSMHFLDRHIQTRRLAGEITRGALNDEEKVLQIFSWVTENIRPIPAGFPVLDDHILYTILRGYGGSDQRTEAFALLASYSGSPAMGTILRAPGSNRGLHVALVRIHGRIFLFDVLNRLLFKDSIGKLIPLEDLVKDPTIVANASNGLHLDGVAYKSYFLQLNELRPTFYRMEDQKPWFRLRNELRNLLWKPREE